MRLTVSFLGASFPATDASTTRSIPPQGSSCETNAPGSWLRRVTKNPLAEQRSQKDVIHTVGPVVGTMVLPQQKEELKNCYINSLKLAEKHHLESIAFCCISTGEFHFPNKLAAKIAVENVDKYLTKLGIKQVIFNVFKEEDYRLYTKKFLGTGDF